MAGMYWPLVSLFLTRELLERTQRSLGGLIEASPGRGTACIAAELAHGTEIPVS